MRIQYSHTNTCYIKYCVAVATPDMELVRRSIDAMTVGLVIPVELSCGIQECSIKDNYNKSIGRTMSQAKMERMSFKVRSVDFNNDVCYILLYNEEMVLRFKYRYKCGTIYFIHGGPPLG